MALSTQYENYLEPQTYEETMKSPDNKKWKKAISEEYELSMKNARLGT